MKRLATVLNTGINQQITKGEAKLVRLINYICFCWKLLIVFFIVMDFFLNIENFLFNIYIDFG